MFANSSEIIGNINHKWFVTANKALVEGNFQYSKRCKGWVSKFNNSKLWALTVFSIRINIIEKTLLNAIEPFFEGL